MKNNNNKKIKILKAVESNNNNNISQEINRSTTNNCETNDNCIENCTNNINDNDNEKSSNSYIKNPFKRIFNNLINMFGISAIKTKATDENKTNTYYNNISETKNITTVDNSESFTIQDHDTPTKKKKFSIEFKEIKNAKYKNGGKFKTTPKWIVVHYTAVIGAGAESCAKSYAKTTRAVSTHFFCDSSDIYRVVNEKYIAWHVGNGSVQQPYKDKKLSLKELVDYGDKTNWRFKLAAENHLKWISDGEDFKGNSVAFGVDICTLKKDKNSKYVTDDDWYFKEDAIKNAEKCVAYLCHKYSIDIEHVIRHADSTGKPCPRPMLSLSEDKDKTKNDNLWFDFKRNVQFILDNYNFD